MVKFTDEQIELLLKFGRIEDVLDPSLSYEDYCNILESPEVIDYMESRMIDEADISSCSWFAPKAANQKEKYHYYYYPCEGPISSTIRGFGATRTKAILMAILSYLKNKGK